MWFVRERNIIKCCAPDYNSLRKAIKYCLVPHKLLRSSSKA
ncbi:hypothetical protein glysoja_000120 [Glycine soja]|nr:hypothetical protein glysoja_000120 [Glycine soja]